MEWTVEAILEEIVTFTDGIASLSYRIKWANADGLAKTFFDGLPGNESIIFNEEAKTLNPLFPEFKYKQYLDNPTLYPKPLRLVCAEPCNNLRSSARIASIKKVNLKNNLKAKKIIIFFLKKMANIKTKKLTKKAQKKSKN